MKNRIIVLALLAFTAILPSCRKGGMTSRLSDIESYIDSRPDSALSVLRQVDTLRLHTKADKAKFALLHAMALDKNYIDTADTRIIAPAVDYYSRHGSAEEKLKAYMYLGTAQYNAGQYDKAIVSYQKAAEMEPVVNDQNLLGILFYRVADVYFKTEDYNDAETFCKKSLSCFKQCSREDQALLSNAFLAHIFFYQLKSKEAESCYEEVLADESLHPDIRANVEADYALMLLLSPETRDEKAYDLFRKAISQNGKLQTSYQQGAYAYLLHTVGGLVAESDSLFNTLERSGERRDRFAFDFWKHKLWKSQGNYRKAYNAVWAAKEYRDSVSREAAKKSAIKVQKEHFEKLQLESSLKLQRQRMSFIILVLLFALALAISFIIVYIQWIKRQKELNRMTLVVESLKHQMKNELNDRDNKIAALTVQRNKARFSQLSLFYEEIRKNKNDEGQEALKNLYTAIKKRANILNDDPKSQKKFEKALNEEENDIMIRFREDYPDLPEREVRLASLVFAGFDNEIIMFVMDYSSPNYTRSIKSRLKKKISSSVSARHKAEYLSYFEIN